MDVSEMIKTFSEENRRVRSQYHITLGKLIGLLEYYPKDTVVLLSEGGYSLSGDCTSYRGYYSDLALCPSEDGIDEPITVGQLLSVLRLSLGEVFTGYKGGDFVMDEDTPLWVDNYGEANGNAIVEFRDEEYDGDEEITLIVKRIN